MHLFCEHLSKHMQLTSQKLEYVKKEIACSEIAETGKKVRFLKTDYFSLININMKISYAQNGFL